jgi:hypothetical protein
MTNRPMRHLVAGAATQESCRRSETRMDTGFTVIRMNQTERATVSATRRTLIRLRTKPSERRELACRFVGTLAF